MATAVVPYRPSVPLTRKLPGNQASPEDPKAKPVVRSLISRAYDSFSVGSMWLQQLALNEDSVLRKEGFLDLKLFDSLLDDDVAMSAFQQRRLALVSKPWLVEPGDGTPQAKAAADHMRLQIDRLGWDRICDRMLYGLWYGYAVGECLYKQGPDGKIWLDEVVVPDRNWFGFTNEGELRMRSPQETNGLPVPPNTFWAYRAGATHDFAQFGQGLAHWAYWPIYMKRNGINFWAMYLEKIGLPTTVGKFDKSSDAATVAKLLEAAKAVGKDSAIVIPNDMELEPMDPQRGGASGQSYELFLTELNEAVTRIILGQTMTARASAQGIGSNQADVHKEVRDEIVQADSDVLHETFNRGPAKWLTRWNFGEDVAPPRVYRKIDDDEDINQIAERDVKLHGIGIRRTDASIEETYGPGYEYHEPEPPVVAAPLSAKGSNVVPIRKKAATQFAAMDPAPLYIRRDLLNQAAVAAWAKKAGFKTVIDDMHVTQLYSKVPVDWFEMAEDYPGDTNLTIGRGGPRKLTKFDGGAVVLQFHSGRMQWRHEEMLANGASHDFPEYLTHVTLSYDAGDIDLESIEPYIGELKFGPEIFEPIDEDWKAGVSSVTFSADDLAAIDRLAIALADDANPVFHAMAETLRDNLEGVTTTEGLRVALLQAFEQLPDDRLAAIGALPMVAARAAAMAGIEEKIRA